MSQSVSLPNKDSLNFNVATEARQLYEQLSNAGFLNELKGFLPDSISVETFVRTAKTAVQTKPDLLHPALRDSLMQGIVKAAQQGLLPDGKHGALIDRYDTAARKKQVVWQPMVHGIKQLGRRSGAFSEMIAHIVFEGEEIELLGGMENTIRHKIDPKIVDEAHKLPPAEFWKRIVLAYCIFVKPNGKYEWRYMTRQRLLKVANASQAKNGPWNGPFLDEMIRKSVIMFAAKDIDIDGESPDMQRLRAAISDGMDADFEQQTLEASEATPIPGTISISNPPGKLSLIADSLAARDTPAVVEGKQEDQVGEIKIGIVTPPEDSPELKADREKRQRAENFVADIIRGIRQAIENAKTEQMAQKGAVIVVSNSSIQKNLGLLKFKHNDLYNRVLTECCDLRVMAAILLATEVAYGAFHSDLLLRSEEIAKQAAPQVNVNP